MTEPEDTPPKATTRSAFEVAIEHHRAGRFQDAVQIYERVLHDQPDNADAYNNLGLALKELRRIDNAIICFERALKINPRFIEAYYNFGSLLKLQGRLDEAVACYEKALAIKPHDLRARWNTRLTLPILYDNNEEISSSRKRWIAGLDEVVNAVDLTTPGGITEAVNAVLSSTSFRLHYQGYNDLAQQKRYGDLVHRIASAAYPDYTAPLAKRKIATNENINDKIRVGFVSSFFHGHTIYKLFAGWITELDRACFETHVFYKGTRSDAATRDLKARADFFREQFQTEDRMVAALHAAKLDVIIFPDIGMDPRIQLLASLRLAPVQCMSWGHPVTSGLPTVDYFLSSDLMEPADGEAHYAEKLIRLPNLSIYYSHPKVDDVLAENEATAETDKPVVFLCSQSLFKILPDYYDICAAIVARVPDCKLWFISDKSPVTTKRFNEKLRAVFAAHDLDADQSCVILPRMNQLEFFQQTARADIFLDTTSWSGGNTTLETIALNKPVVTLPGAMMRSRHSTAILKMLDCEETIAKDVDDYVDIAVRLATDAAWRNEIIAKITANKDKVFHDKAAIRGLERFLIDVCASDA